MNKMIFSLVISTVDANSDKINAENKSSYEAVIEKIV